MKNKEKVWASLGRYKENRLGISQKGMYGSKEYNHILPKELYLLNIFESYRKEIYDFINANSIKLHRNFHHLNSSQGVALNFFYPLIQEEAINFVLNALSINNDRSVECTFEKVLDTFEGTNFDFFIMLDSGKRVFVEIKYTEDAFGKTKDDPSHVFKYEKIYSKKMHNFINNQYCNREDFFNNYQLFRNVMYLNKDRGDIFLILFPSWNDSAEREVTNFIENMVVDDLKRNVIPMTWEILINKTEKSLINSSSRKSYIIENSIQLFKEKYLNINI